MYVEILENLTERTVILELVQMRTDFTKTGLKKESGTGKSITIR